MPRISEFYGIVVEMYVRDHPPPHFHVRYSGEKARIAIATGAIIDGWLPTRAHRLVRQWVALHREELQQNWKLTEQMKTPRPIDPLP